MKHYHIWVSSFVTASFALMGLALSTVQAASISGQGTWESTLQPRNLEGNTNGPADAYYDTSLNITWLANANYASTTMDWPTATTWAANLNPYNSGITGWRLPTVTDTGTPGCNFAYSGTDCGYNVDTATGEMAHLFYTTLGDKASHDTLGNLQAGYGLTNTGPFSNVRSFDYWSATEYAPGTYNAWLFGTYSGFQGYDNKANTMYAWAVHAGDVGAAVPVPTAVWLFSSGLLGLIGMSGKRRP